MKRLIDVIAAALGIALLGPLLILIGAAVRISMGSPAFFRQRRAGLHGRPFMLTKFRTMHAQRPGEMLLDHERLTRLGAFIRKWSLDELPELWNVLRGELSLVGPRPLLVEYLPYYRPEHARRHNVKPGLTGAAQINGRQYIKFSERLDRDIWYLDHWSLRLDFKIMFLTVFSLLRAEGLPEARRIEEVDDIGLSAGLTIGSPN